MQQVEDVLGQKWSHHIQGQSLKAESDLFKDRLQPDRIFQNWLKSCADVQHFDVDSPVFVLKESKRNGLQLAVNFNRATVELFKEVRYLSALGLRVPYELRVSATEVSLFSLLSPIPSVLTICMVHIGQTSISVCGRMPPIQAR